MGVLRGQGRRAFSGVPEAFPSHHPGGLGRVWGEGEECVWESRGVVANTKCSTCARQVKAGLYGVALEFLGTWGVSSGFGECLSFSGVTSGSIVLGQKVAKKISFQEPS